MLFYLFPFFVLAGSTYIMYISKLQLKSYLIFLFFACLPAICIALLSGHSGTDKQSYYTWIDNTINGNIEKVHYEPGFKYFTLFLSFIYPHVYFIIPVVGFLTSCLLILSYSRNKWQLLVFTFYIFPFFYFDMTMNGLRYGLSFALVSLAAHQLSKKNENIFLFFVFSIFAISIQYFSFLIIILIYLSQVQLKNNHLILLCIFGFIVFIFLDLNYFFNKVVGYKDMKSPSAISGLSSLFLFFIIFFFNWFIVKKLHLIFFIMLGLEIASFIVSMYSYSGLRFQHMVLFSLMLFIAHFQESRPFDKRFILIFILIGCLSILLKMRNFRNEDKSVDTPFLPYEFFWERKQ